MKIISSTLVCDPLKLPDSVEMKSILQVQLKSRQKV